MADERVVEQIHDWFDVLVVLADSRGALSPAAATFVSRFADLRTVYIIQPDGAEGPCKSDRSRPGVLWIVHCPPDDGPNQAERIWRFLRDTRVRRPLIWVDTPDFSHFLDRAAEDFKIAHVSGEMPADILRRCDLIVAETAETVAELAGAEFRDGVALWAAPYDYAVLNDQVADRANHLLQADKSLNILVLYDDSFTHIKPIQEHLSAFSKHSKHRYFYFPVRLDSTLFEPFQDQWPTAWDFDDYDAVIWHYCLRAAHVDNLAPLVAQQLAQYGGLKILFIQDDYDTTLTTWDWVEKVGIQLVMTCIPAYGISYAFPDWKPGVVEFLQTHTGFVPEDDMDRFIKPLSERKLHLAYRGRTLPYRYGSLGREKYLIGVRMKALAAAAGVPSDIEVDDDNRIYGDDWYRFTASARATLASETASHVFDFDGSITTLSDAAMKAGVSYDDFYAEHLSDKEHQVRMNQVSPRVFEAIRLKTALVCFEGEYSGAIQPNLHYIPLKKDFSNAQEVLEKLGDLDYLEAIIERAYTDVILGGQWSHAAFVRRFDRIVQTRLLRSARRELLTATVARRPRANDLFTPVPRAKAIEYMLNTGILRAPLRRADFAKFMNFSRQIEWSSWNFKAEPPEIPPDNAQYVNTVSVRLFEYAPGATVRIEGTDLHIETPQTPGAYGVYADLDLSDVNLDDEYCWVKAVFRDISGGPLLGVCSSSKPGGILERALPDSKDAIEVYALMGMDREMLLIRSGPSGAGRCTLVSAEVVRMSAYDPSLIALAQRLSTTSKRVLWPDGAPDLSAFYLPRPQAPPADARLVLRVSGRDMAVYSGGGTVTRADDGVLIESSLNNWSYAGAIDLSWSNIDFKHQYCWMKVVLEDVCGDLRVSAWDKFANEMHKEHILRNVPGHQEVIVPVPASGFSSVLIRKGLGPEIASGKLISIEFLAASAYSPAALALAKELSEQIEPPSHSA